MHVMETSPASEVTLVGMRVLVVDDDEDCRELFRLVLEMSGASVATAAGAREGLREFHRRRPDVLVSDLSMPDEDGCWLAGHIRDSVGTGERRPSAVAVTAHHDEREHRRCVGAGFDVVLTKPIDPDEFCSVVERLARAGDRQGATS
jgi:two-component system, OmpR family, response regulator